MKVKKLLKVIDNETNFIIKERETTEDIFEGKKKDIPPYLLDKKVKDIISYYKTLTIHI